MNSASRGDTPKNAASKRLTSSSKPAQCGRLSVNGCRKWDRFTGTGPTALRPVLNNCHSSSGEFAPGTLDVHADDGDVLNRIPARRSGARSRPTDGLATACAGRDSRAISSTIWLTVLCSKSSVPGIHGNRALNATVISTIRNESHPSASSELVSTTVGHRQSQGRRERIVDHGGHVAAGQHGAGA